MSRESPHVGSIEKVTQAKTMTLKQQPIQDVADLDMQIRLVSV
jgi:hypothetical protein